MSRIKIESVNFGDHIDGAAPSEFKPTLPEKPSSPRLTKSIIRQHSSRRKSFRAKNEPYKSGKKVSTSIPSMEMGDVLVLAPEKVEDRILRKKSKNRKTNGVHNKPKTPRAKSRSRHRKPEENGRRRSDRSRRNHEEYESRRRGRSRRSRDPHSSRRSRPTSPDRRSYTPLYSDRRYSDRSSTRSDLNAKFSDNSNVRYNITPIKHKKPGIILGGHELREQDMDTDSSESNGRTKEKRSILEKKFPGDGPESDAELREAIKIALSEENDEVVREALANGEELSAKVYENMRRPDQLEKVIEQMVSKRREEIRSNSRRLRKEGSPKAKIQNPRSGLRPMDDSDPIIKTVDEGDFPNNKSLSKDDVAKILGELESSDSEEPVLTQNIPTYDEDERDVKLPNAYRPRKPHEMSSPDAIGQTENIYDPLGVDGPIGGGDVGDDEYEESSEDESKLTVDEKKDEMLYRFRCVKEAHPNVALPRITKRMKLGKMVRMYEHVQSRIKLKVKTGNFKIFLIGGFFVMQWLGSKAGVDTSGFTVNQMYSMKRYEKYLREIGEADWSMIGVNMPIYIRLPIFMAINMGIFVVAKFIFKKTGNDYTEQFHKLYAQLTGGDDYAYINDETGNKGLDFGSGGDGGGGGIFGIIKSFLGMMGGGGGGEKPPARSDAKGPSYKRRRRRRKT